MACEQALDQKIYDAAPDRKLSMRDLLNYFAQQGALRVSDLHLKVGCPPTYRVDGDLKKMKGQPLDAQTIQSLAQSLLSKDEFQDLRDRKAVDSSYFMESLQFRLNCFYENELANKNTYGVLYSWSASTNGVESNDGFPNIIQGICPSGWHLPSDEEWKIFEMFLGMSREEADAEGD